MATKNKKVKVDYKRLVRNILTVLAVIFVAWGVYQIYRLGYKKGYLAGTENQVICQASQANGALKPLCK